MGVIMEFDEIILGDRTIAGFKSDFEIDVIQILKHLNTCETAFKNFILTNENPKFKWVQEYVFLSLETSVTSLRLLAEGHINAAGNTMRISYESLCMSILLSSPVRLKVGRGKQQKEIDFYSGYLNKDAFTKAHLSIDLVVRNASVLGVTSGKGWLKQAKDFYNGYSHASEMVFSSLILKSGKSIIGGGYNEEKREIISAHLKQIHKLAKQLPELIKEISLRNQLK